MGILDFFGSIEAVWLASKKELIRSKKIPSRAIPYFFDLPFKKKILTIYDNEVEQGADIISYPEENYPSRLRNIPDPPIILFGKGGWDTSQNTKIVSIVGTRKPTRYGLELVEECIESLKSYQPVIVSGMAFGIDAHAHRVALESNLNTLGIMANGLGKVYPTEHNSLARKIIQQGGLLTEYSYHVKAEREHFPMRNRIVAGLADVTVVIESGKKGGSMITAWMANEYQREVCTYPGRTTSSTSQGPHHLIKTHQAHLVESGHDIAQIMGWKNTRKPRRQLSLFAALDPEEKALIGAIEKEQSIHIDQLAHTLDWTSGKLSLALIQLELKGLIIGRPGNLWQLAE